MRRVGSARSGSKAPELSLRWCILGVVELVVWDKDMLKKDYLGEAWIPLEDWFRDGNAFAFEDMNNKVCYYVRLARARFLVPFRSLRTFIPYAGDPKLSTRTARS